MSRSPRHGLVRRCLPAALLLAAMLLLPGQGHAQPTTIRVSFPSGAVCLTAGCVTVQVAAARCTSEGCRYPVVLRRIPRPLRITVTGAGPRRVWNVSPGDARRVLSVPRTARRVTIRVVGRRIPLTGVRTVSAGQGATCGVLRAGRLACWGGNADGVVGDGTTVDRLTPVQLPLSGVTDVGVGWRHACAVVRGRAWCWGAEGRVGRVAAGPSVPRPVPGVGPVRAIAAGVARSCAIRHDGRVACWGSVPSETDPAPGTESDRIRPPEVVGGVTDAASISVGSGHACAVRRDGAVLCWGRAGRGQLGDGTTASARNTAGIVPALPPASAVVAAGRSTCALLRSGEVSCWGANDRGTLGDGTTTDRPGPVRVVGLDDAVALSRDGSDHVCAVRRVGGVVCWGRERYGQLGAGTADPTTERAVPEPVAVRGITAASAVTAGFNHSCAIRRGAVLCWGYGGDGAVGGNSRDGVARPRAVTW